MVLALVKDPPLCWPSSQVTCAFLLLLVPELTPGRGLSLRLTSFFSVSVHACSTEVFNSTSLLGVPPDTRPHTSVSLAAKNLIKLRLGAFYIGGAELLRPEISQN